jgi:peptidoglycan/xylan/chitin deacetylase (PgdA/CDA1 family)
MIRAVQRAVRAADAAVACGYLSLFRERGGLLGFMFHSLFRDEREIARDLVDPLQRTTVDQFRQFVEYYLQHGYRFVAPPDLAGGLNPGGKYALISFDDGYFNNTLALPVLDEFRVPATFFIATDYVRANKCFWWDVLYRERAARGASGGQIGREANALKSLEADLIEAELAAQFGPGALAPRGDIDRPISPDELRDFARHPRVHLGNHTAGHAILTNYPPDQARRQVEAAQEALRELCGVTPAAIAYPNGGHDWRVVRTCAEAGLAFGFTMRPEKTPLLAGGCPPDPFRLGRFAPHGDEPMLRQCRTYRSDLQLYGRFRDGYLRLARGKVGQ